MTDDTAAAKSLYQFEEEEIYPDFIPVTGSEQVPGAWQWLLPDDLISEYQAARSAYQDARVKLIVAMDAPGVRRGGLQP